MTTERWKPIKNVAGLEVSDAGRVRGNWHGLLRMIREPQRHPSGYLYIPHRLAGRRVSIYVHREVARAFLRNPGNKKYVEHINGVRADCRASNLRWVSARPVLAAPARGNKE